MHLFQQMPIKDMVLCNTAIAGYAEEGDNEKALGIFKKMGERNTVSWNSLISGYTQNGFYVDALAR